MSLDVSQGIPSSWESLSTSSSRVRGGEREITYGKRCILIKLFWCTIWHCVTLVPVAASWMETTSIFPEAHTLEIVLYVIICDFIAEYAEKEWLSLHFETRPIPWACMSSAPVSPNFPWIPVAGLRPKQSHVSMLKESGPWRWMTKPGHWDGSIGIVWCTYATSLITAWESRARQMVSKHMVTNVP